MLNNINNVFSVFSIFLSLVFAWYIAFTDLFMDRLHGTKRTVFIVILLLYAGYRIFRLVKSIREQRSKNQP